GLRASARAPETVSLGTGTGVPRNSNPLLPKRIRLSPTVMRSTVSAVSVVGSDRPALRVVTDRLATPPSFTAPPARLMVSAMVSEVAVTASPSTLTEEWATAPLTAASPAVGRIWASASAWSAAVLAETLKAPDGSPVAASGDPGYLAVA